MAIIVSSNIGLENSGKFRSLNLADGVISGAVISSPAKTGSYSSGGFNYDYWTLTASTSLVVDEAGLADVLVVGGGGVGGPGGNHGGGGGAGEVVYVENAYLSAETHTVTIGAGRSASSDINTTLRGLGGQTSVGQYEASGGGSTNRSGGGSGNGFIGGVSTNADNAGGGGGATANGADGSPNTGGAGGAGFDGSFMTGASPTTNYYGGGGGGAGSNTGGAGGVGGGGAGANFGNGTSGTANTGGGGGGAQNATGGAGGSGIVIVRVKV